MRMTWLAALALWLGAASAAAATAPVNTTFFGNLAVQGYDVVAYFEESKPVEGSSEHTLDWNEGTWRFASAASRDRFKADPERYAPQYGGYCAYAVSQGHTAPIDPKAWSVVDGKLYLNYDVDVREIWNAKQAEFIRLADQNWPRLLKGSLKGE